MKGTKRDIVRALVVLLVVVGIYLLPLGEKPKFIEHNGEFIEVPQYPPILEPFYPERITASCNGGPGFNCNTGCCRDGLCVVCPQDDPTAVPVYPPVINAGLDCSAWGSNGWCMGNLSLSLSASDPQNQPVLISGSIDGNNFACAAGGTSCSIPINSEGTGSISYRADSATGLFAEGSTGYKLDVTAPDLDGSLSGVNGSNGWYVSDVDLSASASDDTSGLASLGTSINGNGWTTYTSSINFTNGVHTVTLSATDNAGNTSEYTLNFNIDTITPSLSLAINGTKGQNGWYNSSVQVTPSASDAGSGVDMIEASANGGIWSIVSGPLSFADGDHTYQFKVTDNAGNVTESPAQDLHVDATAPDIQLVQETSLGETLYYEVQDDGSELVLLEFAIEDEDETFGKIKWQEDISGDYYEDGILWDGKFAGGIEAPSGTYYLTIYARDAVGNESHKTGIIHIDFFSFLQNIPPFEPPTSSPLTLGVPFEDDKGQDESASADFGGSADGSTGEWTTQEFTKQGFPSTQTTSPDPAILWGVAAAAAVGAFAAEAQRKREEQEAAKRAGDRAAFLERIDKGGRKNDSRYLSYKQRGEAYQRSLDSFKANLIANGVSATEAAKLNQEAIKNGSISLLAEKATEAVSDAKARQLAYQVHRASEYQSPVIDVFSQPAIPSGLSPEAQQAFLHGSTAAQNWINTSTPQLHLQYVLQMEREQTEKKLTAVPPSPTPSERTWVDKLEDGLSYLVWHNPIFQGAIKFEPIKNFYQSYTAVVGDSLRSIADPERNPRTAAVRQTFADGIKAWQAIEDMHDDVMNYTIHSALDGRWNDTWRGSQAYIKQEAVMAKYTAIAAATAAINVLLTPIRIFTYDIPEFIDSGKERMEGKDRFWDVLFTGTNLMGDVAGTYGMVKPIGLVDSTNSWISNLFKRKVSIGENVTDIVNITITDDIYAGVRQASKFLQENGISREYRVQYLQSFDAKTIRVRLAGQSEFGIRFYDNVKAFPKGRTLFESFPASRQSLAVKAEWNDMLKFKQWKIRPESTVIEGNASSQGEYLPGGQLQKLVVFLEDLIEIGEQIP